MPGAMVLGWREENGRTWGASPSFMTSLLRMLAWGSLWSKLESRTETSRKKANAKNQAIQMFIYKNHTWPHECRTWPCHICQKLKPMQVMGQLQARHQVCRTSRSTQRHRLYWPLHLHPSDCIAQSFPLLNCCPGTHHHSCNTNRVWSCFLFTTISLPIWNNLGSRVY